MKKYIYVPRYIYLVTVLLGCCYWFDLRPVKFWDGLFVLGHILKRIFNKYFIRYKLIKFKDHVFINYMDQISPNFDHPTLGILNGYFRNSFRTVQEFLYHCIYSNKVPSG